MAINNSINNESSELTIDPGASGDSFVQFNINSTGEFRIGVDDDASDAFKISQGSALGTNDTFIMTADGERTMPLQSAFLAKRDSALSNVTGDGTNYTSIVYDGEIFDQNSDYDNTTGVFTAPATGKFYIFSGLNATGLTSSHTRLSFYNSTSNGQYYSCDINGANARNSSNEFSCSASFICDMDAADTAIVNLFVSGGTKVVSINGDAGSDKLSYFGGYLAC
jgi:hypothetical protein